jgi:hypothetical protein
MLTPRPHQLEEAFLELRSVRAMRSDMGEENDALKRKLKSAKQDAMGWQLTASAKETRKQDRERWKDIKAQQDQPLIVVREGNFTEGKSAVALEAELKAVRRRLRGEEKLKEELALNKKDLAVQKKKVLMLEKELKTASAVARRHEGLSLQRGASKSKLQLERELRQVC